MAEAPDNRTASPSPLLTWGRLLRVPNLFTVPGDPIAGYMLVTGGWADVPPLLKLACAVVVALCLYCAGLLLNDYFDQDDDARDRPERPIPSGAVQPRTVLIVGGALLTAGAALGFGVLGPRAGTVALVLALLVLGYDAGLKLVPVVGPFVMGSCRAGSVLLGAFIWRAPIHSRLITPALVAAGIVWAYTTAVSLLAAEETKGTAPGRAAYAPSVILAIGGAVMLWFLAPKTQEFYAPVLASVLALLALLFAVAGSVHAARAAQRGELGVPRFIGRLVRTMIPVQLAWTLWRSSMWFVAPQYHLALTFAIAGFFGFLMAAALVTAHRFYGS